MKGRVIVRDTPAASIMAAVADADDADREVLRGELFEVIDPIYRRMQDYHFRQVHFHLSGTTSFLRMHNPDRFGDPLADVRPTVRIANREHLIQALFVITVAALLVEVLSWQVFRERTRLKAVARTDQLTGIMNRRALREHPDRELALCGRYGTERSVLLFDIVHFKEFNDRYGHAEGDRVLVTVATWVAGIHRSVDYVARWGGEEFIAVLPNTGIDGGYDTTG